MKYLARIVVISLICTRAWALPMPTFRTVALTGQQAPGAPAGARFGFSFTSPTINSSGQTAFFASLQLSQGIVTTTNDVGIWSEGAGSLNMLAREGDSAPGLVPLATYGPMSSEFRAYIIADSGDVAWRAIAFVPQAGGGTTSRSVIWSGGVGNVAPVAINGDPAPTLPNGMVFSGLGIPAINASGQLAFATFTTGGGLPSQSQALWAGGASGLSLTAVTGGQASGTPAGTIFTSLHDPRINDTGEVAFVANLNIMQGVVEESGIWKGTPGSLNLVARDGDPVPGLQTGAAFDINSNSVGLNANVQVAFRAGLAESSSAGVDQTNNVGIWSEGTGQLRLVAREGEQPPGMPAGHQFRDFGQPLISDKGSTAFAASTRVGFTGPLSSSGIWSDASGQLELIAGEQFPAPGIPHATFRGFYGRSLLGIAANGAGHLAFTANVEGSGITFNSDSGLWAQDPSGMLRLLVREGDLFDVAPGDQRIVSSIGIVTGSGGSDGLGESFNDNHQLAFYLLFADGSRGVFVAQLHVPEPWGPVLCICGLLVAGWQRLRNCSSTRVFVPDCGCDRGRGDGSL